MFVFMLVFLFVVLFLYCEDVCWILGWVDLFVVFFFLGGLFGVVYVSDWKIGVMNWCFYFCFLMVFIFVLMSKELVVMLFLVVVVLFFLGLDFGFVSKVKVVFVEMGKLFGDYFVGGLGGDVVVSDGKD